MKLASSDEELQPLEIFGPNKNLIKIKLLEIGKYIFNYILHSNENHSVRNDPDKNTLVTTYYIYKKKLPPSSHFYFIQRRPYLNSTIYT